MQLPRRPQRRLGELMKQVTIGLIQLEPKLGDKEWNLAKAEEEIRACAAKGARIICLPELFLTGYNLDALGEQLYDLAEEITGPAITSLQTLAKELAVYLIAPIAMRKEAPRPLHNAAVFIDDTGEVQGVYEKNHLFGNECDYFTCTGEYPVFKTRYGTVGIMICADNNHPEPARILAVEGAELIFMPSAWRIQESDIWPILIRCHALENNVFLAACNMYSKMDGLFLFGHSMVAGPRGEVIAELTEGGGNVLVQTVDLDEVKVRRASMPSLKDRHPDSYGVLCEPVQEQA